MTGEAMRIEKVPTTRERMAYYEACAEKEGYQLRMYAPQHQPHQGWRIERLKALVSLILPFTSGKVLEVGCADGMFTQWLSGLARQVTAIDIIPICIERCRQLELENVEFVCGTLAKVKDTDFDLAIASEVLEHCVDPEAEMVRLRGMARGVLATVPITEMPNPEAFSVEAYKNPQKAGDGSGHIWAFREDTIRALFEEVWHYETNGIFALIVGR